jgi:hypothetical protein
MREEFEQWASRYHGTARMGVVGLIYSNEAVQHDWNVWQTSRQSLVVKLPELYETPSNGKVYFPEEITDALDTVGVRYE